MKHTSTFRRRKISYFFPVIYWFLCFTYPVSTFTNITLNLINESSFIDKLWNITDFQSNQRTTPIIICFPVINAGKNNSYYVYCKRYPSSFINSLQKSNI